MELQSHSEEPNVSTFICMHEGCKSSFTKKRLLLNHMRKHGLRRPFACEVPGCTNTYTNISHLRRHKRVFHNKLGKNFKCTAKGCDQAYHHMYELKKHLLRVHGGKLEYPFTCPDCKQGFYRKNQLQKHSYLHTGENFKCDVCSKEFASKPQLARHIKRHVDYNCKCGEVFQRWHDLIWHHNTFHKVNEYKCELCDQMFTSKQSLTYHAKTHKSETDRDAFVCPIDGCERFYVHKKNLVHHIRVFHEKQKKPKIPCPIENCNATLARMQCLTTHLEVHKNGVKKTIQRKRRRDAGIKRKSVAATLANMKWSAAEDGKREKLNIVKHGVSESVQAKKKNNVTANLTIPCTVVLKDFMKKRVPLNEASDDPNLLQVQAEDSNCPKLFGVQVGCNKDAQPHFIAAELANLTLSTDAELYSSEPNKDKKLKQINVVELAVCESVGAKEVIDVPGIAKPPCTTVVLEDFTKKPVSLNEDSDGSKLLHVQVAHNRDSQPHFVSAELANIKVYTDTELNSGEPIEDEKLKKLNVVELAVCESVDAKEVINVPGIAKIPRTVVLEDFMKKPVPVIEDLDGLKLLQVQVEDLHAPKLFRVQVGHNKDAQPHFIAAELENLTLSADAELNSHEPIEDEKLKNLNVVELAVCESEGAKEVIDVPAIAKTPCTVVLQDFTKKPVPLNEDLDDSKLLQVQVTYNKDAQPNFIFIEYEKNMDLRPENFVGCK